LRHHLGGTSCITVELPNTLLGCIRTSQLQIQQCQVHASIFMLRIRFQSLIQIPRRFGKTLLQQTGIPQI
jgi:hypothetical protein